MISGPVFTATSSESYFELGYPLDFKHPTYGWVTAVYVKNGSGGALAQGDLLRMKSGETTPIVDKSATASLSRTQLIGVADHAVASNYYFWAIARGGCVIKGDGSVTSGSDLVADATAGRAKNAPAPASATEAQANAMAVFGRALADDGAAGSTFSAIINQLG